MPQHRQRLNNSQDQSRPAILDIHRTYSVRITNNSTRNGHRLRRTEDEGKAFVFTVPKEDTSPVTAIRKRTTIISLGEEITQEQDTVKEELQEQHSEPRGSSTTPSLVFSPLESHPEALSKSHSKHLSW
jgi:hypothetical protein